jgi:hypothetical protein
MLREEKYLQKNLLGVVSENVSNISNINQVCLVYMYNLKTILKQDVLHSVMSNLNSNIYHVHFHAILTEIPTFRSVEN